jgi:hypothetical protein
MIWMTPLPPGCFATRVYILDQYSQYLSCALVRGHGNDFRHYYRSLAKSARKDFRDGAVVLFE